VIALICLYSPLRTAGGGVWPSGSWFADGEEKPAARSANRLSDKARRELARIAEREVGDAVAKSVAQAGIRAAAEPAMKAAGAVLIDAPRP
jgi:hypothetical protein